MNNLFTEAYLSVICEAWDRFDYLDIIKATNIVTNNCNDAWVKGDTGSKVLALLKKDGYMKHGGTTRQVSNLLDQNLVDVYTPEQLAEIKAERILL
jgi:hypothetical protein